MFAASKSLKFLVRYPKCTIRAKLSSGHPVQKKTEDLQRMTEGFNKFGTFLNDAHYLKSFELLLLSLEEESAFVDFCVDQMSKIPKFDRMLDIGPGSYELTKILGKKFDHISIVDLNEDVLALIDSNPVRVGQDITKYHCGVQDLVLAEKSYDFVLCSHVLYYVPSEEWVNVASNLFMSLRPGGKLIIALAGDEGGTAPLVTHFGGKPHELQSFVKECQTVFGERLSVRYSYDLVTAASLETMTHLAGFLLSDCKMVTPRAALVDYLETNCRDDLGGYSLQKDKQTWMVFTKK